MLRVKLSALEHPTPDITIDCSDRKAFASIVLWLEDQKIRHYTIEDRAGLRKVEKGQEWEKAYKKYKVDIGMPKLTNKNEELTWLLGYAVRLEYLDAVDAYKFINSAQLQQKQSRAVEPSVKAENAFDNMDFHHKGFVDGVKNLATKLGIPHHPDHLVQLEAINRIIVERLTPAAAKTPIVDGKPFPFEKGDDVIIDDKQLDYAARILRLLQIQDLRQLQTVINETIVSVQELTADPKTDTKLGKVGY
uniref:Putative carnitine deficiency associated protein n=1 Tax=Tabanus bromius TaxID=304241 RepID=A0A0K8TQL6_TABBR